MLRKLIPAALLPLCFGLIASATPAGATGSGHPRRIGYQSETRSAVSERREVRHHRDRPRGELYDWY